MSRRRFAPRWLEVALLAAFMWLLLTVGVLLVVGPKPAGPVMAICAVAIALFFGSGWRGQWGYGVHFSRRRRPFDDGPGGAPVGARVAPVSPRSGVAREPLPTGRGGDIPQNP